ncbi:hypothetical protein DIPPA_15700 [Diplonema papillatum]|nr:hypothetical protein DIPPA_15700 [Diplonema papillatum]
MTGDKYQYNGFEVAEFIPFPNYGPPALGPVDAVRMKHSQAAAMGIDLSDFRTLRKAGDSRIRSMIGYGKSRPCPNGGPSPNGRPRTFPKMRKGPYVPYAQYVTPPAPKERREGPFMQGGSRVASTSPQAMRLGPISHHPPPSHGSTPHRTPSSSPVRKTVKVSSFTSSNAVRQHRNTRSPSPSPMKWNYSNQVPGLFEYVPSLPPGPNSPPPLRQSTTINGKPWKYDNRGTHVFHYETTVGA